MAERKNQHFVPQFYLRNFSSNSKTISLYNISKSQLIPNAPIKSQCAEHYFYGKNGMEEWLSQLEGNTAELFRQLRNIGSNALHDDDNVVLCIVFTMIMMHRTLAHDRKQQDLLDGIRKVLEGEELSDSLKKELESATIPTPESSVFQGFTLAPYIADLEIVVLVNESATQFITSDNPVVKINPYLEDDKVPGSRTGYYSKGLVLYMPTSPHTALMFYDGDVYTMNGGRAADKLLCVESDVNSLNQLMYMMANENVYFEDASIQLDVFTDGQRAGSSVEVVREKLFDKRTGTVSNDLLRTSAIDVKLEGHLSFLRVRKDALREKKRLYAERKSVGIYRSKRRLDELNKALGSATGATPNVVYDLIRNR